ncbi:hypothetical protein ES319_D05G309700v1 [Gossypium barbadense]|uniref:Uncharacterized protein n=2 Tax=Gossypium TaxID=3633 RepID=A0A5J5RJ13_GOSBA|nr:hypothetical protein ES319_D05G309700v1 [Gossypium barbadense]TYG70610.1 hypothetical protein ES288_D05G327000v1 [Gossypium darwinii]
MPLRVVISGAKEKTLQVALLKNAECFKLVEIIRCHFIPSPFFIPSNLSHTRNKSFFPPKFPQNSPKSRTLVCITSRTRRFPFCRSSSTVALINRRQTRRCTPLLSEKSDLLRN